MIEQLISSEVRVKADTSMSDNVAGKYLLPALRDAQEIWLRGILGDTLLDKIKTLIQARALSGTPYEELVARCQHALSMQAMVEIGHRLSYKYNNAGVTRTTDENLQAASEVEVARSSDYWQTKADSDRRQIQNYLLNNSAAFPELTQGECHRIHADLMSSASCGIFLGGARGKGAGDRRNRR